MKKDKRLFGRFIFTLSIIFFYLPILYVVIFSFNSSKSLTSFSGFSLEWYKRISESNEMMVALYTTIAVAIIATLVSTFVGTISAIGLFRSNKLIKRLIGQINDMPIMNPEIVTAIGFMLLFTTFKVDKGLLTMLLAHISFCIPYVILSVMPKIKSLDENLAEAAMDLGATPWQALYKVIVPQIKPGIIAGALIAFTMSVDDFVISYFVSGRGVKNLSMVVYTMSKRVNPSINSISALIILAITIVLIVINISPVIKRKLDKKKVKEKKFLAKNSKEPALLLVAGLLAITFGLGGLFFGGSGKYEGKTLHVYNWGEYTDHDTIAEFERETGAKVVLDTFDSNEQMYIKLANGESYDVIFPSDYMIERLIRENKIQKLDPKKLDFLDDIYSGVRGLDYDPNNEYSVPYFWGTVGILYDTEKVSEEELEEQGFDIFRNPKYKGETYLYDSERDSFMMALKALGFSMNTKNEGELNQAYNWLLDVARTTKPEIVTDEIIDNMAQGRKALAIMYSGDAAYAMSENENMAFYLPKSGTNLWSDAMVIPKNAKEVELAHEFIRFNSRYETAIKNSTFVGYTASNEEAYDFLRTDKEYFGEIDAYTPRVGYEKDEIFHYDESIRKLIANLWSKVKILATSK